MKNFFNIIIVFIVIILVFMVATFSVNTENTKESQAKNIEVLISQGYITFKQEINPELIGSYNCHRNNLGQTWTEFGEWENNFGLAFDSNKKIGLGYNAVCNFRSDSEHYWDQIWDGGRYVFVLKNK